MPIDDSLVRRMLQHGIRGADAQPDPAAVLEGVDFAASGKIAPPYQQSIYQIAYHMHVWAHLKAILFQGGTVTMPSDNCFPQEPAPAGPERWESFQAEFKQNILTMERLVAAIDLERRYPIWDNMTAGEMVMMMINHNSYHTAQIVALRRSLGLWQ